MCANESDGDTSDGDSPVSKDLSKNHSGKFSTIPKKKKKKPIYKSFSLNFRFSEKKLKTIRVRGLKIKCFINKRTNRVFLKSAVSMIERRLVVSSLSNLSC